ncbi:MAG TPA: hypothetical protein VNX68_00965 [Nitrosopumilaceae archaeon]|nr:hypothetical protein [Nitrosopumilaceae archaeon]
MMAKHAHYLELSDPKSIEEYRFGPLIKYPYKNIVAMPYKFWFNLFNSFAGKVTGFILSYNSFTQMVEEENHTNNYVFR